MHHATIHTTQWPIRLTLYVKQAPNTVANFVTLARAGFYDGLKFHRVIDEFMIQWGDPQGTGTGWPWYKFSDEFHPDLRHDIPWVLSMANSGPNSNGSQFFITHIPTDRLDDKHSVFGRILDEPDLAIVNAIHQWNIIEHIEIMEDVVLPEEVSEFVEMIQSTISDH